VEGGNFTGGRGNATFSGVWEMVGKFVDAKGKYYSDSKWISPAGRIDGVRR
jgi:hypothetical protein